MGKKIWYRERDGYQGGESEMKRERGRETHLNFL
jgi:hypothetical protein